MRRLARTGGPILLVCAAFLAGWVRLPYYALGPGPARDVTPLIHVAGTRTYGSSGHYVLTTVRFAQVTAVGALVAWIDPDRTVVPQEVVYPPGLTPTEEARRAASQMDQSKIDAAFVVLTLLTDYPDDHRSGALIEQVVTGCSADGRLAAGDVIHRIDGERVSSAEDASAVLGDVAPGGSVTMTVETVDGAREVRIAKGRCPGIDESIFGITTIDPFPLEISIESGDVGGPSAGLMWGLGLYDLLTPGDLTRGRTIAGTGQIDPEGRILPIGAITDKVVAALEAGADVLFVPKRNASQIADVKTGGMQVIPIETFEDAVAALEATEPPA